MAKEKQDAVQIHASQLIFAHRERIVELTLNNGLPSIAGGLVGRGRRTFVLRLEGQRSIRSRAHYVDKILNARKPRTCQSNSRRASRCQSNLKTAKALV